MRITPAAQLGLFLWLVAVAFIAWKIGFEPGKHTVVTSYLLGAERWLERADLYTGPHGFIYMPTFALLFSPLAKLPLVFTDLLWRAFLLVVYFYSLAQLLKAILKERQALFWQWFGLVSLVALPIAFSGLRNGQMNVLLSAVMILVTAWLVQAQWNYAALLMALVMSLKPTFAVFFLLVLALYKPLWWRVPPLLVGFLCLPLVAGAEYGITQYINFYAMSHDAMELGMAEPDWATLFNIFPQVGGFFVPEFIQLGVKISLALGTLWYCYRQKQRYDSVSFAIIVLTLACCYHMLFNPRSVNTDYVILGTVMAFWFAAASLLWHDRWYAGLFGLNAVLILLAYELSKLITPDHHSWVNPLAALLFSLIVLWQIPKGRVFQKMNNC